MFCRARSASVRGGTASPQRTNQAEAAAEPAEENSARPGTAPAASGQQIGAVNAGTRTELNLLGQTDTASGESRRNENVQINLIDNNVLKELNQRIGTTATIVKEFRIDQGYFGTEFGGSADFPLHVPSSDSGGFHGNLHATHNNSVFSARSFFQVARSNQRAKTSMDSTRDCLFGKEAI